MKSHSNVTAKKIAALAAIALAVAAEPALAQTLTPNSDATATLAAGVRYRNFGGSGPGGATEIHLFNSPYVAASATTGQGTWPASSSITVTYNGSTLSTTAAGGTSTRTVGNLGSLNYIEIAVVKNGSTGSVALNNIALNGGASLGNASVSSAPNSQVWKISGANLTSGFTLTGTVATTGLSGGGDSNHIQIEVGNVPPTDSEGPIVSNVNVQPVPVLINGNADVSANVSDATTGGSNIASAEYQVDGVGVWQPMSPTDGSFESPDEDAEVTYQATNVGTHEVCVRGTDALGNTGAAACQTYLVTYVFDGFFSPIENDVVNVAKAGQAIPAKWRLTDANELPIADPASFIALSSYMVSCVDFSGDIADSVEEIAPGSSGLQYNGDGYWQFNWKTPKTYADTCRAMYVEFDSGAISPVVKFRFKK